MSIGGLTIKNYSGGSSMYNYSLEEQVVGTWIDGSTLYEKTIIIPYSSFTTDGSQKRYYLRNDIPNGNFKVIEGLAISASYGPVIVGSRMYAGNDDGASGYYEIGNYYYYIYIRSSDNSITTIDIFAPEVIVTIKYTKTTD